MPELHNREKVLVQYRLLKDFDDLRRRGIPGIDVRVMEDNIYEWHVTMSPISGHFSGLRIHMVLLLPEDYPRKPPKVELYNFLPHANVFRDFLQNTSLAWAHYWQGSSPARGKYVLCTDLLELKPPPLDPNDSRRHEGWSPSYSVEAVLVQLQCLLFDDYVHSDLGRHINTLWDNWYAGRGQGRKSRQQVCAELHQAQLDADAFHCPACGYCGLDDSVAFYDSPEGRRSSDEESESEAEECQEQKGTKREHTFVSRKKQKKRELEKLKVAKNPKVDFKQLRLYMEIANANSALRSGHALRRVPGVFRVRDVVSFRFHGVPDEVYLNGHLCINRDLQIFNYGHEVEYPWRWYDPMLDGFVYRRQQPPEEEEKKTGKVVWERFVNSQNGGGKLKAEDTPGTEAFVKKREQFYAVGVVESVNVHTCTVSIVIVENDATMGSATAPLTDKRGEWAFNSEQHSSGLKATLYKNVPMEKACIHGYEGFVAPYDHPPPAVYKPVPGHYTADEFLAYDVTKDSPVELLKLLENGEEVEGLTRQKLALLPEGRRLQEEEAPTSERSSVLEGWEVLGDGSSVEGSELELWSLCESDSWDLVSRASQSNRSFEVVSMVYEQSGSLSHSFHVVPSGLSALSSSLGSYDLVPSQAPSQAGSVASRISVASERSLLTLRSALPAPENFPADRGHPGSWQLLSVLCKLNVPLRGTVRSLQDFGAFVSLDATPRDLAVQNNKLVSGGRPLKGKGKGKSKGKGKGKSDGETKMLQDGLLPCLPYMRPSWPPGSTGEQGSNRDSSVMVNGNVFEQMGRQTLGPAEVVVYISEVDVNQRRMKLSLQPRLTFEELRIGGKHEGIVVDTSHLGLFVALSDSLVGLLPRAQLGVGAFAEGPEEDGWYRRSVYKRGDIVTVWVLRKALADANSRRRYKIDLTMDKYNEELSSHFLRSSLKVLDAGASGRQPGAEDPKVGKTAMDLKFEETFDAEDKFFLIKNNRLIKDAMSQYPELVIDYTTDPPPPPQEATKTKSFDFSLIEGWSVRKITEEHKRLCDKQHKFQESAQGAKPLSKEEERLLTVLKKKVEHWGNEYYEGVCKKIERHQKFIEDIHRKIKEERDKYPYKSIIDLDKFRELSQRIAEKGYHERCCFVTRLCYKEDVLGVGLEIVPESDTGRKIFQCSFDLLSKEAFKDFGIRSGVWKEKVEFWLPLAIDARHFRRALPYLAECFRQLGDGRVEAATRSYGTQAGNGIKSLRANLRELQRTGQKMLSLEEYKKQKAQPEKEKPKPEAEEEKTQPVGLRPAASLTEADVAYGLEVLPKLMNLQTVQLMKGDLHLSTKALEGYMGFHHLLLSILRQYPSLQAQVESKIGTFLRSEAGRTKQSCPNLGEFLCLLAVSKKYTWDDVSAAVLKETLDRNASWALDKYPSLAGFGTSPENRLERTFKASIVSIRLLCFNVWFLRNVVFKRYGAQATSAEILEAEQRGGPKVSCTDMRWAEYEEQKGIPRPEEINMLQEQMRRTLHGNGLNSWSEYFVNLNLQPLKADDLSQLLVMSLHDSVRKGYIPLWKMRALQQKNQQEKAPKTNDYLGADMDKYDSMHTTKGGGDRW